MIKKKILPILLGLILAFAMIPMAASAEDADTGHAGQDGWTKWSDETKLPSTGGKYYLTQDVTISSTWYVPEGETTICLNGKTVKLANGHSGSVIHIGRDKKLTICDHSSGGNGCITGGNERTAGGGVFNLGTFTMKGGIISGNTVGYYGGGVYNTSQGTFNMSGGSISGNTAENYGGGVVNDGTFNIGSGENENITISGNKTVTTVDAKAENVYLKQYDNKIHVNGKVSEASKIGVTTEDKPSDQSSIVFTDGLSGKGSISNFFSDEGYAVTQTEGNSPEAQLTAHKHKWTIEKVLYNECEIKCDEINCPYSTCTVTAKADNQDYTGKPYDGATITADPNLPPALSATWTYEGIGDTAYGLSAKAPTNVGAYTAIATIKVEADPTINQAMSSLVFRINKVQPTVTEVPAVQSLTYNATAQQLVIVGAASGGTMWYAIGADNQTAPADGWSKDIPEKTDAKPYFVWYQVKGDSNHNDSEPGCVTAGIAQKKLTITAKNQTCVYNGKDQGPGNKTYTDPAEIKDMVTVNGLEGSDALTGITIDGKGKELGKYDLVPSKAAIGTEGKATGNYDITYANGILEITPIPLKVTIKGSSTTKTYSGKEQTYKGTVTAASKDKAFDPSKFSYTGSTIVKGTKAGSYTTVLSKDKCVYKDKYYKVNWTIGDPVKLTIKPGLKPGPLITKIKAKGKKSLTLSWAKVDGADGYDIFFTRCNHGKKHPKCKKVRTIKVSATKAGTIKWTKKHLKGKKAYKAYVRAWTMKDGKKTYIKTGPTVHAFTSGHTKKYTNARSVTVRKTNVSLTAGTASNSTYKIKAKVIKLKKGKKLISKRHAPILRYISSDKRIATVSKSGKIKAMKKGTCYVYAYAHNGAYKAVKVTVK